MSWRDTLSEAQSRLTALEAAELQMLSGTRPSKVQYAGGSVDYAPGATLADLKRDITETRMIIQRLSGGALTGGRIMPVFRG
jgi:hypothetical protein